MATRYFPSSARRHFRPENWGKFRVKQAYFRKSLGYGICRERCDGPLVAGPVGFEPTTYSSLPPWIGGCRAVHNSPCWVCATSPLLPGGGCRIYLLFRCHSKTNLEKLPVAPEPHALEFDLPNLRSTLHMLLPAAVDVPVGNPDDPQPRDLFRCRK